MRVNKRRLLRWWTYFRRGHNTYLVFLLSFANFIVIQYRLLITYIPFLTIIFSSLTVFACSFFLIYVPLAIMIGWYDFRKLAVPVDTALSARASPWVRDLAKALILIAQGKNDEAIEILEKWTKEL
ncbi:MAG: hypothetical protein ACTSVA_06335 [Candidatus Njordarchaeales archaeon]